MWISEKTARGPEKRQNLTGITTIGGGNAAVYTDVELRKTAVYSPGGYFWYPKVGQDVIVIKSDDKEICIAGSRQEEIPAGMEKGDVFIKSDGAAIIKIKKSGKIILSGQVEVEGSLKVNGNEIE